MADYKYNDDLDNPDKLRELIPVARNQEPVPEGLGFVATQFFYTVRGIYILMQYKFLTEEQAEKKIGNLIHRYSMWAKTSRFQAELSHIQGEAIQKSEWARVAIRKEKDPEKKLELALECIRLITGDKMVK